MNRDRLIRTWNGALKQYEPEISVEEWRDFAKYAAYEVTGETVEIEDVPPDVLGPTLHGVLNRLRQVSDEQ